MVTSAIKVLFVVCLILLLCVVVFFFLWRMSVEKRKSQKETIDKLVKQLNEARQTNSQLEMTISILKKNRESADEKIRDLYSGDAVDNAIKHLSKQQN